MVTGRGYLYGCPHPDHICKVMRTDIHTDVGVESAVLRTVRPGWFQPGEKNHSHLFQLFIQHVGQCDFASLPTALVADLNSETETESRHDHR